MKTSMNSMKPSTIQSLSSSNSLYRTSLVKILGLTVLVLFPISLFLLFNFNKIQEKKNSEKRAAIEKIIKASLVSSSQYGDMIYGRASSLELGKNLGLIDLGICDQGADILERPDELRCKKTSNAQSELTYDHAQLNGQNYELEYRWKKEGQSLLDQMIYSLLLSLVISVIFFLPVQLFLLNTIVRKVKDVASALIDNQIKSKKNDEFKEASVPNEFKELAGFIQEKTRELEKATEDQVVTSMAKRVSHDIRSPIIALNSCFERSDWKDSEDALLIKQSLKRINDIAEDLLLKGRQKGSESYSVVELNKIVKNLAEEKKLIYGSNVQLEVLVENQESYAEVKESDLLRALSNLINNAIEALKDVSGAKVVVRVFSSPEKNTISIADNGPGFPENIVKKIGKEKLESTKDTGNGLGLMTSWQMLEGMGAQVELVKTSAKGSEIAVSFSKIHRPEGDIKLVLIDDEKINHLNWKRQAKDNHQLLCFFSKDEFFKYLEDHDLSKDTAIFLDVDLKNDSGIDVALTLHEQGFLNLNLATGHEAGDLKVPDYIRSVRGKKYPY